MQSERRSKRAVAQVGQVGARSAWLQRRLAFGSFRKIGFLHLVSCLCATSNRWPSKQLANLAIQASAVLQPKASRAFLRFPPMMCELVQI